MATIGETAFEKYQRLLFLLEDEQERADFRAHIIARFCEEQPFKMRGVLDDVFKQCSSVAKQIEGKGPV